MVTDCRQQSPRIILNMNPSKRIQESKVLAMKKRPRRRGEARALITPGRKSSHDKGAGKASTRFSQKRLENSNVLLFGRLLAIFKLELYIMHSIHLFSEFQLTDG
jgi:hypothetical protein